MHMDGGLMDEAGEMSPQISRSLRLLRPRFCFFFYFFEGALFLCTVSSLSFYLRNSQKAN